MELFFNKVFVKVKLLKYPILWMFTFFHLLIPNLEGQNFLSVGDVFDFEVNDEFHITDIGNNRPPNSERLVIKDKYYSTNFDTVFYSIFYNNYSSIYDPPNNGLVYSFYTTTKKVNYTNLDSSIFTYFNDLNYKALRDSQINNPEFYFEYDSIFENSQILCDVELNGFQVNIGEFEPKIYHNEFGKGLGIIFNEFLDGSSGTDTPLYSRRLFYYKKGDKICGTPDLTNDISNIFVKLHQYSVIQIPELNLLKIIPNNSTMSYQVEVYNISGILIFQSDKILGEFSLNVRDMNSGINILKIKSLNKSTEVYKVIL